MLRTPFLRTVAVLLAALAAACSGDEAPEPRGEDGGAAASPARQRVDWFLEQVNSPPLDADELAAGFAPQFLEAVPPDELVATTQQAFGSGTEWTVDDASMLGELEGEVRLVSAEDDVLVLALVVEAEEPHLISGALLQPGLPEVIPEGEAVRFEDVDALLGELDGTPAYGVYDVSEGECRLLHGIEPEVVVPIGSTFKLWVLAALADEVANGRATWEDELPVNDAWKSSTDGEISSMEAGTPVTLRRYAELMISVSDNSATDHLLHHLGRQTVEQAMAASGVADPQRNIPMLSTRELFLLKYGGMSATERYLQGDSETRRQVLDELAGVGLLDVLDPSFTPSGPTLVHELEWFASAADVCRTHLHLARLATQPGLEPVAEVLSMNPGVSFAPEWTDVRFKGGSEPGVLHASWHLTDDDGRAVVIAGGVVDTTATVPEGRAIATLAAAARAV